MYPMRRKIPNVKCTTCGTIIDPNTQYPKIPKCSCGAILPPPSRNHTVALALTVLVIAIALIGVTFGILAFSNVLTIPTDVSDPDYNVFLGRNDTACMEPLLGITSAPYTWYHFGMTIENPTMANHSILISFNMTYLGTSTFGKNVTAVDWYNGSDWVPLILVDQSANVVNCSFGQEGTTTPFVMLSDTKVHYCMRAKWDVGGAITLKLWATEIA